MTYTADQIARVCHEANAALQRIDGDPAPSPHWDDAPEWQRESAVSGVLSAQGGETPGDLHESWCRDKLAAGWVYGEVKDPQAKTHPCLTPYGQLPEEQKVKDAVFVAIVGAFS